MGIKYSIPVRIVGNNGALKCTIPKQISTKMDLEKGKNIVWILYEDGTVEVKKDNEDY